jgi:hypothetical protein
MDKQLPVVDTSHNLATTGKKSATLLGRGLAAIQNQKLVFAENDKPYRQSRDIYNRITDYGIARRFNSEAVPKQSAQVDLFESYPLQPFLNTLKQLADVFMVFQQLADQGYGKAYFPLACMYQGGQGISPNAKKTTYYSRLAFLWNFANRVSDDPEIWADLGGCTIQESAWNRIMNMRFCVLKTPLTRTMREGNAV